MSDRSSVAMLDWFVSVSYGDGGALIYVHKADVTPAEPPEETR